MPHDMAELQTDPSDPAAPITRFAGDFAFLSNFYPHPVSVEGDIYPTTEHAFQALKTHDPAERAHVRQAPTPAAAKQRGKRVTLWAEWDTLRFDIMAQLVAAKFTDPALAAQLRATGTRELIEGNTWRDTTWGCVRTADGTWRGRNALGQLLMQARAEISGAKEESAHETDYQVR